MRRGTVGLVGALLFLAAAMIVLSFTPFSWAGWTYESCGSHNCYCEPFRDTYFVRQPFTAASNFGYLAAGMLVLQSAARQKKQNRAQPERAVFFSPVWYGISLLLAGCFSFFSHASLTRVGEWFDLMGVYLLEGTLLVLSLKQSIGNKSLLSALLIAILTAGAAQMAAAPQLQMIVIGVLLAGIAVSEIAIRIRGKARGENGYLIGGTILYLAGAAVWRLSSVQGGCLGGVFPGHILWHLLSATAAGVLFFYYFPRTRKNHHR